MLSSTSPGATREAMDAAFEGPDPPLGAVPDEPDPGDPPEGNWPKPPDGAPPKPLPGSEPTPPPGLEGPAVPLKPVTPGLLELPMASPMIPPTVPATSRAAAPPATASTRRPRRLLHEFWPPGPGHPAWPPGGPGGGPYAQPPPGAP